MATAHEVAAAPSSIGPYRLQKQLGQGAFARVYEGLSARGERVAVKLLTNGSQRAQLRFRREIKVLQALPDSPYIAGYKGHGSNRGGRPWLALELVEGYTLRDMIHSGVTFDEKQACALMAQLCEPFAALHRLGLTHGDIKPGNIMLTRDGSTAKLLDFGLVRDAQGLLRLMEEESMLSGTDFRENLDVGMLMGTPDYMAPEQIQDAKTRDTEQWKTDTPADVYGLAVLLFELVCGRRPVPFDARARNQKQYWKKTVAYLEARLERDDADMERPQALSPELWSVVSRALRRDPRRRQGDARTLQADLFRFLATGLGVPEHIDQDDTMSLPAAAIRELLTTTCQGLVIEHLEAAIPTMDVPLVMEPTFPWARVALGAACLLVGAAAAFAVIYFMG